MVTGREQIARTVRGHRVMAIVRAAIGPRENSVATRNFLAERRIATATEGIARATGGIAAIQNSGRRVMLPPDHAGRNSRPPRDGGA